MKHKIFLPFLGVSLVAFFLMVYAFSDNRNEVRNLTDDTGHVVGSEVWAPGGLYSITVTPDTLTNTEKDTVNFSDNIISLYTYCLQPTVTQLSGTAGVKVYLDQATDATGTTAWFTIDSTTSLTNAAPRGILDGTDLLGYRYRLRFVGTGTASVRYICTGRFKKKN